MKRAGKVQTKTARRVSVSFGLTLALVTCLFLVGCGGQSIEGEWLFADSARPEICGEVFVFEDGWLSSNGSQLAYELDDDAIVFRAEGAGGMSQMSHLDWNEDGTISFRLNDYSVTLAKSGSAASETALQAKEDYLKQQALAEAAEAERQAAEEARLEAERLEAEAAAACLKARSDVHSAWSDYTKKLWLEGGMSAFQTVPEQIAETAAGIEDFAELQAFLLAGGYLVEGDYQCPKDGVISLEWTSSQTATEPMLDISCTAHED